MSATNEVSIRSMVAEGTEERFLALHIEVMTSCDMLWRAMIDLLSLAQPTLKAGYMQKVPTDNIQGVVRYGKLARELTSRRPMSSFTAWCPDALLFLLASRWWRCVPGKRQVTWERSMHLSPVSTDNVATLSGTAARGGD